MVGAIVDVSSARCTEDRRRELSEELGQAQKMEAVGRLAGGIAHDYNNLLAIILNCTSLVIEELDEQSPVQKDLAEIKRAAQRAASLTRQLLTVSRRGLAQPVVLDLQDVVRGMDGALRAAVGGGIDLAIARRSVGLPGAGGRGAARAGGDEPRAERARRDARRRPAVDRDARGPRRRCEEPARRAPGGPAWPVRAPRRERHRQRDVRRRADARLRAVLHDEAEGKGTGLGLATVYGIVKQWHGHIELASQPGQGTRVEIYLPLSARGASSRRARAAHQRRAAPRPGEGGTVLVTDDEDAVVTLASRILGQHGYTTLTACGPREALRVCEAQRGRVDLLLTDVLMPEMSGGELAARLVKLGPDMKVLFMSGYTGDALDGPFAVRPGAAVLGKPFTAESLLRAVRRALEGLGRRDVQAFPTEPHLA